jgi:hypothetical protein
MSILGVLGVLYTFAITMNAIGENNAVHLPALSGKWILLSVSGHRVQTDPPIFFRLDGEVLTGYDGCNNFGGLLSAPARIRTGGRGCPEDHPAFPLDLSHPAKHLAAATRDGDRLLLPLLDGTQAVFVHSVH